MRALAVADILWKPIKVGIFRGLCGGNLSRYLRMKAAVIGVAARFGMYEGEHLSILKEFVRKGDWAIDVGAHYGVYAQRLAALASPGSVVAFEPLPEVYEVLKEVATRTPHLICERCAVSDGREANVELSIPYLPGGVPEPALATQDNLQLRIFRRHSVPCKKLDDYHIGGRLAFVKIDVEGHEDRVLLGMRNLIEKYSPVIQVEISAKNFSRALLEQPFGLPGYSLMGLHKEKLTPASALRDGAIYYLIPAGQDTARALREPAPLQSRRR